MQHGAGPAHKQPQAGSHRRQQQREGKHADQKGGDEIELSAISAACRGLMA
jgi:hypothetical protein